MATTTTQVETLFLQLEPRIFFPLVDQVSYCQHQHWSCLPNLPRTSSPLSLPPKYGLLAI